MRADSLRGTYVYRGMPSTAFESRSALNSADFFTPYLKHGMIVLDCGCGPGTITLDFAEIVAPGEVWGIDMNPEYVARAQELAGERKLNNTHFRVASIYELPFPDQAVDAAFLSSVLEHLSRPLEALAEIKRVLKPGGLVGIRDADVPSSLRSPSDHILDQTNQLLESLMRRYDEYPTMGRELRFFLHQAGFANVKASASYESHGEPESIQSFADTVSAVFGSDGLLGKQLLEAHLADSQLLESIAEAWRQWAKNPGAFLARSFCNAVGWKP